MGSQSTDIDALLNSIDVGAVIFSSILGSLVLGVLALVVAVIFSVKGLLTRRNPLHHIGVILFYFFVLPSLSASIGAMAGGVYALEPQLYALLDQARPHISKAANLALFEFRDYLNRADQQIETAITGSDPPAAVLVAEFQEANPSARSVLGEPPTLIEQVWRVLKDRFRGLFLEMAVSDALADQPAGTGLPDRALFKSAVETAAARLMNPDVLMWIFQTIIRTEARRYYSAATRAGVLLVMIIALELGGSLWLRRRSMKSTQSAPHS